MRNHLFSSHSLNMLLLALVTGFQNAKASELEKLHLITEVYPPTAYYHNRKLTGAAVELLEKIWQNNNISSPPKIDVYPWARAYQTLLKRKNTMLFAIARTKTREDMFHWACPIAKTRYDVFAKKSDKLKISTVDELKKYTIGTVRSDVGEQELMAILSLPFNILSNTTMRPNLELMDIGRVDVILFEYYGAASMFKEFGRNPDDFESVYTINHAETCYAFSKDVPKELVNHFQQSLNYIIASPDYEKIIRRHYQQQQANAIIEMNQSELDQNNNKPEPDKRY